MTAPISGSENAAWKSARRCAGVPAKYRGSRSSALAPNVGTKPRAYKAARPRSVRSGFAEDAGATMVMAAPGATAGGLIRRAMSPCLSARDERGRSSEEKLFAWTVPCNGLCAAGRDDCERRNATAQSQRSRSRCRAAGAGRGGGPHATLEDANFDLVLAHDAHKFHVGLLQKIAVLADLSADHLPGFARDGEGNIVDQDDEVRIAGNNFDADDFSAA